MSTTPRPNDRECSLPFVGALALAVAATVALLGGLSASSDAPSAESRPLLCEMVNPATGEHAMLYREPWSEVPAGYDERAHIEAWRAEQIARGFTREAGR